MTHLSTLTLDELAAGLPIDEAATAHLATCAPCQAKLEHRRAANQALLASPESRRRLDALTAAPARLRPRLAIAAGLALAASLLLWWSLPGALPPGDGLKGVTSVELLDARGAPTAHAHPGDLLTLAVGAGGHRFGAILALDETGAVTALYPAGASMARLDGSARQRLDHLRVTAGTTLVIAFFADEPRPLQELLTQVRDARAKATGPFQLSLPGAAQLLISVD